LGGMKTERIVCAAALAVPMTLAAFSVAVTVAAAFGGGLWPPDDVSLAEAAATRNYAEVVRLVRGGSSPNANAEVRQGVLDGSEHRITPFEVAVASRDERMAMLLLRLGANPSQSQVLELRCAEWLPSSPEFQAVLERMSPGATSLDCP